MANTTQRALGASSICFVAAVLMVLAGMGWGIHMAASQNHAMMPAHAHLNLLGWVSLFLFGLFYHLHPALDRSRLALVQVGLWIVGTLVMVVGVALIHAGNVAGGEPFASIGSLISVAGMLLFGWLVLRRNAVTASAAGRVAVPAE